MKALKATLLCAGALHAGSAFAWDLDARARVFGNAESLPEDDLQRSLDGTPVYEESADLRLMFRDEYARLAPECRAGDAVRRSAISSRSSAIRRTRSIRRRATIVCATWI